MLLGTSVAYDWIYETLSAADRATIANKIGVEAQRVAAYLPNAWWVDQYMQNHNWIDTAGLGMAALALQGEDARASAWLSLVRDNLEKLKVTIGQIPDGSWHEGLPYEGYGLAMALPFWQAMRHAGSDYTDMGLLRGYGTMLLYAGTADDPEAGDPAVRRLHPLARVAGGADRALLGLPLRRRICRGRVAAVHQCRGPGSFLPELWYEVFEFIGYDPAVVAADPHTLPLDAAFADSGAATLHSSWNTGDLALGFKATVYGGFANFNRLAVQGSPAGGWIDWGHDHNDDMSFWLFGRGVWLAPEAMGYDAGRSTDYTYPANQTAYHNVLLVDGQGQLGDVRVSDSNWNNPWFFSRVSRPLFTPTGTADYAIAGGKGAQLFASSLGISRWDRVVVLARGRYALVRDDVEAGAAHDYDWTCHFNDGVSVDTASGWVQGTGKSGQSLGVRVLSPSAWSATTGTQTAELMDQFDPDAKVSWVRVRPATKAASAQFLTALIPVATAQWSSRTPVERLDANDVGAGAVVAPGSALEERWIFARAGAAGKTAGDLVLAGSQAGMAARDASGAAIRAVLFGQGSLSDQGGARLLLATQSANAIEAKLSGTTLAVTGNPVHDFQAWAPAAAAVTLNGVPVEATLASGMVTYPARPPSADAGTPDAGTADAGTPDAGAIDAGTPDAGAIDAGTPDAGTADAGVPDAGGIDAGAPDGGGADAGAPDAGGDAGTDAGDLCGNCEPAPDGGPNPGLDAGSTPDAGIPDAGAGGDAGGTSGTGTRLPDTQAHGCSHSGAALGWLAIVAALALRPWRRRRGT